MTLIRSAMLTLALAVTTALPATAHEFGYDPAYLWFDAPHTTDAGDARIRIVLDGREGSAALTPNQYWFYAEAYRARLSHLTRDHKVSVSRAVPRARHDAFHATLRSFPGMAVEGFAVSDLYEPRLKPSW